MDKLTHEQAAALGKRLGPTVGYLFRLRERLEKVGFAQTDKLYQRVCRAQDAMYALGIELHYLSCRGGVGGPPETP